VAQQFLEAGEAIRVAVRVCLEGSVFKFSPAVGANEALGVKLSRLGGDEAPPGDIRVNKRGRATVSPDDRCYLLYRSMADAALVGLERRLGRVGHGLEDGPPKVGLC
jgi:hypothetical protein